MQLFPMYVSFISLVGLALEKVPTCMLFSSASCKHCVHSSFHLALGESSSKRLLCTLYTRLYIIVAAAPIGSTAFSA